MKELLERLFAALKIGGYMWVEKRPGNTYFSVPREEGRHKTFVDIAKGVGLDWADKKQMVSDLKEGGFEFYNTTEGGLFDTYMREELPSR